MNKKMKEPYDHLNDVDIPPAVHNKAQVLLNRWDGWKYGRSPKVAAAMAVYYTGRKETGFTQKDVANLFDTTTASMRETWYDLKEDIDPDVLESLVNNLPKVDRDFEIEEIDTVSQSDEDQTEQIAQLLTDLNVNDEVLFHERKQPIEVQVTIEKQYQSKQEYLVVLEGPNRSQYTIRAIKTSNGWEDIAIYQGGENDLSTRIDRVTSLSRVQLITEK